MDKTKSLYAMKSEIETKMRHGYLTSRVLLDHARLIDEASSKSSAFNDPSHFPFYYHLAAQVSPVSCLEFGAGLGLRGACLCAGSKVERYIGQQKPTGDHYPSRFAEVNIRTKSNNKSINIGIHNTTLDDPGFLEAVSSANPCDIALISEEYNREYALMCMAIAWKSLAFGGILVSDYQTRDSGKFFSDFCISKNRDFVVIDTRYGVGIVRK